MKPTNRKRNIPKQKKMKQNLSGLDSFILLAYTFITSGLLIWFSFSGLSISDVFEWVFAHPFVTLFYGILVYGSPLAIVSGIVEADQRQEELQLLRKIAEKK